MEILAVGSFCLTFIVGLGVLFALLRLHQIRRDLLQRIQKLEEQVEGMSHYVASLAPTERGPLAPPLQTAAQPQARPTMVDVAPAVEPRPAPIETTPPVTERPVPPRTATTAQPFKLPPLITWFLERHLMVQIGVLILFIGIAFLLKYAADQGWLSLELRHIGAAVGGVVLAAIGWRLRNKARTYALALQGAGLGVIYLTTFFAYRSYELIPGGLAFGVFVVLGVLCAGLAVVNDARILAFLAVVGAFLAPILASTGEGSHVALFSYYALVNAAIFAIAWFKAWRSLNLAGFGFTLAAASAWGASAYEPELFASTEPFLVLFFLFYLGIAILYAIRQPVHTETEQRPDPVDVTLVFGNPLAAFVLQLALVEPFPDGAAISALAGGLLYTGIAVLMLRRILPARRPLVESFLFLSFFLLALSVPLFFDEQITAALWAVSGAAWVWLGVRRQRVWNIGWGVLVQVGAGIAHALARVDYLDSQLTFLSLVYLGAFLVGVAGLFSAYQVRRWADENKARPLAMLSFGLAIWGLVWWFGGGTDQILSSIRSPYIVSSLVAFYTLSGVIGEFLAGVLWARVQMRWFVLRAPLVLLWPVLLVLACLQLWEAPHHFASGGWYAWPLAWFAHYWMLQRSSGDQPAWRTWRRLSHAGGLWLVAFLFTWFAGWRVQQWTENDTWVTVVVLLVTGLLILLASEWIIRLPALFAQETPVYQTLGAAPLVVFALLWILLIRIGDSGDSQPLPFVPLLNPLDLANVFIYSVLLRWIRLLRWANPMPLYLLWGAMAFLGLNLAIARSVHQLSGIEYAWDSLYRSPVLQTTYAIVWSMLALTLMFWSTRRKLRPVWLAGAAILALTILKLFVVDLSNANTIARIISFIGVGVLVIVIAYFAPAPPHATTVGGSADA